MEQKPQEGLQGHWDGPVDEVDVLGEAVDDSALGVGVEERHRRLEDILQHLVVKFAVKKKFSNDSFRVLENYIQLAIGGSSGGRESGYRLRVQPSTRSRAFSFFLSVCSEPLTGPSRRCNTLIFFSPKYECLD